MLHSPAAARDIAAACTRNSLRTADRDPYCQRPPDIAPGEFQLVTGERG